MKMGCNKFSAQDIVKKLPAKEFRKSIENILVRKKIRKLISRNIIQQKNKM